MAAPSATGKSEDKEGDRRTHQDGIVVAEHSCATLDVVMDAAMDSMELSAADKKMRRFCSTLGEDASCPISTAQGCCVKILCEKHPTGREMIALYLQCCRCRDRSEGFALQE